MASRNIYDLEYYNTRLNEWKWNNWSAPQKSKKQEIDNKGAKFTLETKFKIEKDVKKYY